MNVVFVSGGWLVFKTVMVMVFGEVDGGSCTVVGFSFKSDTQFLGIQLSISICVICGVLG